MVRTAVSLFGLLLCTLCLSHVVHAQQPIPRSYLFVDIVDATGEKVSDATVRVSSPEGKEVANLKTNKDGTIETGFENSRRAHHYDLQITKPGYLPYESVLFPNVPYSYFSRLTEEMPNTVPDPIEPNYRTGPPLKITLRKTPTTPDELRAAALEAKKLQLLLAVKRGDTATLKTLLQEGANARWTDAKGVPAVAWATFAGDPETIKLLLDAGTDVRNKASVAHNALLMYLSEGVARIPLQVEIIDRLIEAGAGANASSPHQGTVLNKAIIQGSYLLKIEKITALIKAGADVNAADANGQTPLMLTAQMRQNEFFDLLLASGAKRSINAKNKGGQSALIYAADGYKDSTLRMVKVLLANGANATEADYAGETPLMRAARAGCVEIVQTLLNAGSSINAKDHQGLTALMYGAKDYSVERDASQIVKLLLAAGAQINEVDKNRRSALMYVVLTSSDLEAVNVLIANGASVNLIDSDGQTALLLASQRFSTGIVPRLLQAGADATINVKDSKGRTALLYAVELGLEETVRVLIKGGADVNIKDKEGQSAIELARKHGRPEIIKLVEEAPPRP